jgi:hypothetical protein
MGLGIGIPTSVYKIGEIPEFRQILDNKEVEEDPNTLKLCKTNIVTRNNEKYRLVKYDKPYLTVDQIQTLGLLRSVIINSANRVVSFAPPKSLPWDTFVNMNPKKTSTIVAEEFIEGTMINVFWDAKAGLAGAWELATRNTVGAEVSFYKTNDANQNKTFREMFLEAAIENHFDLNMLDPNYCYSFVLQHPNNRIVVPFKTPQLYLVDIFAICHTEGGVVNVNIVSLEHVKKDPIWAQTTVRFPQIYTDWLSYDELKQRFACMNTPYHIVGVMVRDKRAGTRTKLRNPTYENVRNLRGNQPKLQYQYLSLRKQGAVRDYLEYYPENKKEFHNYREHLHSFTNTLFNNYISCYVKKEKPLLQYPQNYRTHMFNLHKIYLDELRSKKLYVTNTVVIKYVNDMQVTLQMYSLNYNMRKRREDEKLADTREEETTAENIV